MGSSAAFSDFCVRGLGFGVFGALGFRIQGVIRFRVQAFIGSWNA